MSRKYSSNLTHVRLYDALSLCRSLIPQSLYELQYYYCTTEGEFLVLTAPKNGDHFELEVLQKKTEAEGRKNKPPQGRIGVYRRLRAGMIEEKNESKTTFGIGLDREMRVWVPPETTYFSMNSENTACHTTLGDKYRRDLTTTTACVVACAPPPASFSFAGAG